MEKAGFRIHPATKPGLEDTGARTMLRSVLPPTAQEAASRGYGFAAAATPATAGSDGAAWASSPEEYKAKYTLAYEGPPNARATADSGTNVTFPAEGCAGRVLKDLMGDQLGSYIRLQEMSANEIRTDIQAKMDIAARDKLNAEWDSCMTTAGVRDLGEPEAARGRAMTWAQESASSPDHADAVAREKELAATDATCAEQVGYAGRIHEIESTASTTALETRLPDLLAFHKLVEDATTRARTLMSE